MKNML